MTSQPSTPANPDASAIFAEVTKEDLAALCIFLAGYQDKLQELRLDVLSLGITDEMRQNHAWRKVAMDWPIIQGSRNQFTLHDIGNLPYESAAVNRAIRAVEKSIK